MLWWNHGGWDAGDWLAMSFMMVVFWGLLFGLVAWLIRGARDRSSVSTGERGQVARADEVLAERFARGEIDENEFTRSRAVLRSSDRS